MIRKFILSDILLPGVKVSKVQSFRRDGSSDKNGYKLWKQTQAYQ